MVATLLSWAAESRCKHSCLAKRTSHRSLHLGEAMESCGCHFHLEMAGSVYGPHHQQHGRHTHGHSQAKQADLAGTEHDVLAEGEVAKSLCRLQKEMPLESHHTPAAME